MIILTGANGFIGSCIGQALNEKGIPVLAAVDWYSPAERSYPISQFKYQNFLKHTELWDFLELPSTIQNTTWIIHMGANSSTTENDLQHLWENNTHYTQRIFEWCAKHKKSLIYASSAATYGAGELGYDDETDPEQLKPLNPYGDSKVKFDRWVVKQTQIPPHWYGLKFFNVYGPHEEHKNEMASVIYKSYHQILKDGQVKLFKSHRPDYKDGEQKRDFIYVKDVSSWCLELMEKTPKNGVYNMGTGTARTWNDLVNGVFHAMNKTSNIEYIDMPMNVRNQYQYFTEARMQKWASIGMSAPKWPLEKGIKDYVQTYLQKTEIKK